jgi:hypothetical protein
MQICKKSRQKYYKIVNGFHGCAQPKPREAAKKETVRYLGLTLFGGRCYSRGVPFGRGFLLNVRQLGLSKLTRQGEPTTTKRLTPAVR